VFDDLALIQSLSVCGVLSLAFMAMATNLAPQQVAMPLAACAILPLFPSIAPTIVGNAFQEFGPVALLFTAIAIPAHLVESSGAFKWIGLRMGRYVGVTSLAYPALSTPLLVILLLITTYLAAALFHNITSILVMVPLAITVCERYGITSRYILCGLLVASNLGGFSSSWGDTPNIVESAVWELTNDHFLREVVPINLTVLLALSVCVTALTLNEVRSLDPFERGREAAGFKAEQEELSVDVRRLFVGLSGLVGFIVLQYVLHKYEIAWAALAILFSVLADREEHRIESLKSLDLEVYMVLASIFVIARVVDQSAVGDHLKAFVQSTGGAPWAIALSAYAGTAVTEAASWASAVARATHLVNPSHAGAWALGGGICAGSSALLTSASAGIILLTESRRFKGHEVTFGTYMGFGLATSISMLAFYIASITLLFGASSQ
jgi:Na+/H+ antiporter NhaD/arsenite permease-like protein